MSGDLNRTTAPGGSADSRSPNVVALLHRLDARRRAWSAGEASRVLSGEDLDGQVGRRGALRLETVLVSANDTATQPARNGRVDRRRGSGGHVPRDSLGTCARPARSANTTVSKNDRVAREARHFVDQFVMRKPARNALISIEVRLDGLAYSASQAVRFGCSETTTRLRAPGCNRSASASVAAQSYSVITPTTSPGSSKRPPPPRHAAVDDRTLGAIKSTIPQQHTQRAAPVWHDQVERLLCMLLAEKRAARSAALPRGIGPGPGDRNRSRSLARPFLQARPERLKGAHASRLCGGLTFEQQDAPRPLLCGRTRRWRSSAQERSRARAPKLHPRSGCRNRGLVRRAGIRGQSSFIE